MEAERGEAMANCLAHVLPCFAMVIWRYHPIDFSHMPCMRDGLQQSSQGNARPESQRRKPSARPMSRAHLDAQAAKCANEAICIIGQVKMRRNIGTSGKDVGMSVRKRKEVRVLARLLGPK